MRLEISSDEVIYCTNELFCGHFAHYLENLRSIPADRTTGHETADERSNYAIEANYARKNYCEHETPGAHMDETPTGSAAKVYEAQSSSVSITFRSVSNPLPLPVQYRPTYMYIPA